MGLRPLVALGADAGLITPRNERMNGLANFLTGNAQDMGSIGAATAMSPFSEIRRTQLGHGLEGVHQGARESIRDMGGSIGVQNTESQLTDINAKVVGLQNSTDPTAKQQIADLYGKQLELMKQRHQPRLDRQAANQDELRGIVDKTLATPAEGPLGRMEQERAQKLQPRLTKLPTDPEPAQDTPAQPGAPVTPPAPGAQPSPDIGAEVGQLAGGLTPPEHMQGQLNQVESQMADLNDVASDPSQPLQARQGAHQQMRELDQQRQKLLAQTQQGMYDAGVDPEMGPQTNLRALNPEEQQANAAFFQKHGPVMQAAEQKLAQGGQLSDQEKAQIRPVIDEYQQRANAQAFHNVHQATGLTPEQFQQSLQNPDPNNPVNQMGTQITAGELAKKDPSQQTNMGAAQDFWGGLEGWQKGMLLAGLGMGMFGLMSAFMGGEDSGMGMLAPLMFGGGLAAAGMGATGGHPSQLFSAGFWDNLFNRQGAQVPQMPMPGEEGPPGPASAGAPPPTTTVQSGQGQVQGGQATVTGGNMTPEQLAAEKQRQDQSFDEEPAIFRPRAAAPAPATPAAAAPAAPAASGPANLGSLRQSIASGNMAQVRDMAAQHFVANPDKWQQLQLGVMEGGTGMGVANKVSKLTGLTPNESAVLIRNLGPIEAAMKRLQSGGR
jgi:hypothetical protein